MHGVDSQVVGGLMKRGVARALTAAALLGWAAGSAAQDYGSFTIGAGFTPDPQIGTGLSGGPGRASRFGSQCLGAIDTTADHVILVTSTVNLRLVANSDVDTTLVLVGPAGVFCDDDSHGGLDPEINAVLTPGRYEAYIGNFERQGRYTLILTENVSDGLLYRSFTLGEGFRPDPQTGTGRTGGPHNARRYGAHCQGMVDTTADHRLTITSAVDLRIAVEAEVDVSLVIIGPESNLCHADGQRYAEINGTFQPGEYEIYVGHTGESSGNYVLTITDGSGRESLPRGSRRSATLDHAVRVAHSL